MDAKQADTAINSLSSHQSNVVANVMMHGFAEMSKKVIEQINRLYDINLSHNEEMFTYVLDNEVLTLQANATGTALLTIEDNVNFIWCAWSGGAWDHETGLAPIQPFTVVVKFHGTDRYFHNSHPFLVPIHSWFVAMGVGGGPVTPFSIPSATWLPMPYVLTKNTVLSFQVTNLQAIAIDVRFALHGYRIFQYDSLNMAVRRR